MSFVCPPHSFLFQTFRQSVTQKWNANLFQNALGMHFLTQLNCSCTASSVDVSSAVIVANAELKSIYCTLTSEKCCKEILIHFKFMTFPKFFVFCQFMVIAVCPHMAILHFLKILTMHACGFCHTFLSCTFFFFFTKMYLKF